MSKKTRNFIKISSNFIKFHQISSNFIEISLKKHVFLPVFRLFLPLFLPIKTGQKKHEKGHSNYSLGPYL